MLSVRLSVYSRLLVIKFLWNQKFYMDLWLRGGQPMPPIPMVFTSCVLFCLWVNNAYMHMMNTHVWPGFLSTVGQQASGNFARVFLVPGFKKLSSLSVILVTLSGCDTLPLQNRCFCNSDFHCTLMSRQNWKRQEMGHCSDVDGLSELCMFAYFWDTYHLWTLHLSSITGNPPTTRLKLLQFRGSQRFLFVPKITVEPGPICSLKTLYDFSFIKQRDCLWGLIFHGCWACSDTLHSPLRRLVCAWSSACGDSQLVKESIT